MDRILRAAGATIEVTYYDANGDPAEPSDPVTAAVVDSAGVAISGSPFATVSGGTGIRRFALPVALEVLDVYDVTWTANDGAKRYTQFELVGGFPFTIAELQAFDSDLADEAKYPPARVREIRDAVAERIEEISHRSVVPRGRRIRLSGAGERSLILPEIWDVYELVSASIDGEALDVAAIADVVVDSAGILRRPFGEVWDVPSTNDDNVEVLVSYGVRTLPGQVVEATKRLAKHWLKVNVGQADERATAVFTEIGGYRLTRAGRDGPTGLPEVDAVLESWGRGGDRFA